MRALLERCWHCISLNLEQWSLKLLERLWFSVTTPNRFKFCTRRRSDIRLWCKSVRSSNVTDSSHKAVRTTSLFPILVRQVWVRWAVPKALCIGSGWLASAETPQVVSDILHLYLATSYPWTVWSLVASQGQLPGPILPVIVTFKDGWAKHLLTDCGPKPCTVNTPKMNRIVQKSFEIFIPTYFRRSFGFVSGYSSFFLSIFWHVGVHYPIFHKNNGLTRCHHNRSTEFSIKKTGAIGAVSETSAWAGWMPEFPGDFPGDFGCTEIYIIVIEWNINGDFSHGIDICKQH